MLFASESPVQVDPAISDIGGNNDLDLCVL